MKTPSGAAQSVTIRPRGARPISVLLSLATMAVAVWVAVNQFHEHRLALIAPLLFAPLAWLFWRLSQVRVEAGPRGVLVVNGPTGLTGPMPPMFPPQLVDKDIQGTPGALPTLRRQLHRATCPKIRLDWDAVDRFELVPVRNYVGVSWPLMAFCILKDGIHLPLLAISGTRALPRTFGQNRALSRVAELNRLLAEFQSH